MPNNNFKSNLKINVPSSINNSDTKINLLLSQLGLLFIPKNVQVSISENNKYLNIQLKDTPTEKHLLFQFPLEEKDLSALENRSDYQELVHRYHLYINDYVNEIKKYAMQERQYLAETFPGLVFNIKIRIKSYDSYINKLNENILKEKNPYINDIMAERIIISEYNNSTDETMLAQVCDDVAKELYNFRKNTNFRMKKDIEPNESNSEKCYITKDYIQHPKENGYQSIHILIEHMNNKDFTYETQIRTMEMESISKISGDIAHNKYKPRILNDLSPNRVPLYSEISCFTDEFGNPEIIDIPLENRFYHFYNCEKADSSHSNSKSNSITYNKFRKEQYELENLLGIQFKDIRQKIRNINIISHKKQEVR